MTDHIHAYQIKVLSVLSSLFKFLAKHRRVPINPCAGVSRPEAPPPRERVLRPNEIGAFWSVTDVVGTVWRRFQAFARHRRSAAQRGRWDACERAERGWRDLEHSRQ